jgi:hypothetical protein
MFLPKPFVLARRFQLSCVLMLVGVACYGGWRASAARAWRLPAAMGWLRTAPPADYNVMTTNGALVVTDVSGNGDSMEIGEPSEGVINIVVGGRTFSINGGAPVSDQTGGLPLASLNSITLNLGTGNDGLTSVGFNTEIPSLTVNGGSGNDTVSVNGSVRLRPDAHLDLNLQNDDPEPGEDRVLINNCGIGLSGSGNATIKVSRDVRIDGGGAFLEAEHGNIVIEANQQTSPTPGDFTGVLIRGLRDSFTEGTALVMVTGTGNIKVKGRGGAGTGANNLGVKLYKNGGIYGAGTDNSVSVIGVAGSSGASNGTGVSLDESSYIDSNNGDIVVHGTGDGSGENAFGVYLANESEIWAGGSKPVYVTGLSTSGAGNFNEGLGMWDSSWIGSSNGDVHVSGTARGTGEFTVGVDVYNYSEIYAGGTLYLTGIGGSGTEAYGVWIDYDEADLYAEHGIELTATGGGGGADLRMEEEGIYVKTTDAPITINANSIYLDGTAAINAGTSSVTLRPRTADTYLNLGADDAPAALGLSVDELNQITGGTLILGSSTTPVVTVGAPITRSAPTAMQLIASNYVYLNYTLDSGGGNVTLTAPLEGVIANEQGVDVNTGAAGTLSFGANSLLPMVISGSSANYSYRQLNVVGQLDLTGVNLDVSGIYTPAIGETFTIIANDGDEAITGSFNGLPQNAAIQPFLFTTLAACISYTGGSGNDVVLTVYDPNTAPTIATAAYSPLTRQPGSAASNSTIALVSDAETAAGALTVQVNGGTGATVNGVTVSNLVNTNGTLTADVAAACGASNASFGLTVTDAGGLTAAATLNVTVGSNPNPTVGAYSNTALVPGAGTTVTPNAAPADNGSIASVSATASAGFTGTLTANNTTGAVTISNAGPAGGYTITVTVTDACNATAQQTFALTVNTAPAMTTVAGLSRQQGSPATNAQIATVNDADGAVGSLNVTAAPLTGSGVTLSNLVNTNGVITADVVAGCGATPASFTLTVTDDQGATATATLNVAVSANADPTVGAYLNTTLVPGAGTTVTPNAVPADNGSVTVSAVASNGFTGTLSTNHATGAVTIAGAAPAGVYTITVTITDNCGVSAQQTFALTINTAPAITAVIGLSQQGSPAANAQIATVNDAEGGLGALGVQVNDGAAATANGVTVSNLVNTNGVITADVVAACNAATASFSLTVTDNRGATGTATLLVAVNENTNPTVGNYSDTVLQPGAEATVTPSAALADNGSVTVTAAASAGFTGTLAANHATGAVTISGAAPAGMYTITVTATDNCSAMVQKTFMLTVNTAPTITAASGLSPQQGSPAANAQIAAVNDAEGNLGALAVSVNGGAAGTVNGVTVSNLVNTNGVITADVEAACGATPASFTLTVTDNKNAAGTVILNIAVSANAPPTVGAYPNSNTTVHGSTTVTPGAAPADHGSVVSVTAGASAGFTGNLSGEASSGIITVSNAAPAGVYTITVTVTDNCGATAQQTFALTVNNPPTLSAVGSSLKMGSPAANRTIANVSDTDQALDTLSVTVNGGATATVNGVTISNLSVTPAGLVTADVVANCSAENASFTLTATDNRGATASATLSLTVTANTDPTVGGYHEVSLTPGTGTTVPPSVAPADDGPVTVTAAASAGFTGNLTADNTTGAVTISNAGPAGSYTITVTLTDACNAAVQQTFLLTVNTAPTITAATSLSQQKGSPAAQLPIASVNDAEGNLGALGVQVNGGATATVNGVTVSNLVNTNGVIRANIEAVCNATAASFTLTVSDEKGATGSATLHVAVGENSDPTIGAYQAVTLTPGAGISVTPSAAPADNGSVTVSAVASTGFTGTLSTNNATGAVTIAGAAPAGMHTITVTVTDNCNAAVQRTFMLTVNTAPTIIAAADLSRQPGSPAANAQIATAGDAEGKLGALGVQINGSTSATVNGVTISNLANNNGLITADVAAVCGAAQASFTLTVTDDKGAAGTALLSVAVIENTAPTVGTYADLTLLPGAGSTLTPSAAPADNGAVASVTATAANFTGTFTGNPATGALTIANAGPAGAYSVTVTVTDHCGAATQRTFTLTVNTPPTVSGATLSATPASPASNLTIATVNDADQAETGLSVVVTPLSGAGVTIGTAAINEAGQVTANVQATCAATVSTFQVSVTDAFNATATSTLTINLNSNPAPAVGTYPNQLSTVGGTVTATPSAAPADNGTVASVTAAAVPNTFSGTFSGDPATGALTIANAAPAGMYTVTVTVTDDCGAETQMSFSLTVNNLPQITAAPVTRMQSSPSANAHIATVSDTDQAAETLTVTVTDPRRTSADEPVTINGVTVSQVAVSAAGEVTADVVADCTASEADFTLIVRDNTNALATATLTVTVQANTPPLLTYAAPMVVLGGNLTVPPLSGPSDNGSLKSLTVQSVTPGFAGTVAVDNTTGIVSIGNAGLVGSYTVNVLATDNCGAATTASFPLVVQCPAVTVGPATVPQATAQSSYSQQFNAGNTFGGTATFTLGAGTLPNGLNLLPSGELTGRPTQTGTFRFAVKATDALGCWNMTPEIALVVTCGVVTITPPSLPGGQVGVLYQQSLTGNGGTTPYNFTLANGAPLPDGLTLTSGGLLSGMPQRPGAYTFTVNMADVNGCGSQASYTVNVQCPVLTVLPAALPNAAAGVAYSQGLTGSGGAGPYVFALASGSSLPPGLALAGNLLSGTPTTLGTYSFTVEVTDTGLAYGQVNCAGSRTYTLNVVCPTVTLNPVTLPNATLGTAYEQLLSAGPTGTSYRYTVSNGALPPGLALHAETGVLTGTPTAGGAFNFTVTASGWQHGQANCSGARNYTLSVIAICPSLSVEPASLAQGTVGEPYAQSFNTNGGSGPYSYALTQGALPGGLSLNAAGNLSGTPTASGTFSFTVTVTGAAGCTGSRNYTLNMSVSGADLDAGVSCRMRRRAWRTTSNGDGERGAASYSLAFGNLPPGLNLNAATGALTGTATAAGTYNFTPAGGGGGRLQRHAGLQLS